MSYPTLKGWMSPKSITILKCSPCIFAAVVEEGNMYLGNTPSFILRDDLDADPCFWVISLADFVLWRSACKVYLMQLGSVWKHSYSTSFFCLIWSFTDAWWFIRLFFHPPKLCTFVYLYSSLSVLDYSCRAAPKLPGILSTKLYNSMSKAGFWEILVRSCEESFLVKKSKKTKKETEIFMHTVSMARGTLHTTSFVLTSHLSSYQTNAFLIKGSFCIPRREP